MSFFAQFVRLIDDKYFESFATFGFDVAVSSDLLDNILNDMLVLMFVIGGSHLNMIVAGEYAELNCGRSSLRFENTLLLFQLENMVTEKFG